MQLGGKAVDRLSSSGGIRSSAGESGNVIAFGDFHDGKAYIYFTVIVVGISDLCALLFDVSS